MAKRRPPSEANDTSASPSTARPKAPRPSPPRRAIAVASEPERATAPDAAVQPTEADIRYRAYLRYLERGGNHVDEFDDWLYAERELKKA